MTALEMAILAKLAPLASWDGRSSKRLSVEVQPPWQPALQQSRVDNACEKLRADGYVKFTDQPGTTGARVRAYAITDAGRAIIEAVTEEP